MLTPRFADTRALAGAFVWILFRIGDSRETELIQRVLLLGILVIVPLGLSLVANANEREKPGPIQPCSSGPAFRRIASIVSVFAPGILSEAMSAVWLIATNRSNRGLRHHRLQVAWSFSFHLSPTVAIAV